MRNDYVRPPSHVQPGCLVRTDLKTRNGAILLKAVRFQKQRKAPVYSEPPRVLTELVRLVSDLGLVLTFLHRLFLLGILSVGLPVGVLFR